MKYLQKERSIYGFLIIEKICGISDCQGFQFKERFIPRENAIASENMSQCQEFNARMKYLSEKQGIVLRSMKYGHGLHYCPFNPKEHCFYLHQII